MGIVWVEISNEKGFLSMNRTKVHFWRMDLTIDLIIVVIICYLFLSSSSRIPSYVNYSIDNQHCLFSPLTQMPLLSATAQGGTLKFHIRTSPLIPSIIPHPQRRSSLSATDARPHQPPPLLLIKSPPPTAACTHSYN